MRPPVLKPLRSETIRVIDRMGLRTVASEIRGRWSPSYTSRRDHRDMRQLRVVVAAALGGGGRGVDVGANHGLISAMLVDVAPTVRHVLIEPVAELASQLVSRFPQTEVLPVVCAADHGVVEFNVAVDQMTRSSIHRSMAQSGGRVEARSARSAPLDELLGDEPVAFIKIDVEGAELAVLRGARGTLADHRPVVVFEHAQNEAVRAEHTRAIFGFLDLHRYRLFDIDGRSVPDADVFTAVVDSGRVWTFLAVPQR